MSFTTFWFFSFKKVLLARPVQYTIYSFLSSKLWTLILTKIVAVDGMEKERQNRSFLQSVHHFEHKILVQHTLFLSSLSLFIILSHQPCIIFTVKKINRDSTDFFGKLYQSKLLNWLSTILAITKWSFDDCILNYNKIILTIVE